MRTRRLCRGLRYCATCYARVFKPRACPECGATSRLPIDQPGAVCRDCERRTPCIRCGKVDERRGRTTAEGRLCNACAQRLRPAEPCDLCATPSNRLPHTSALGHELRVCPRCARAAHGTGAAFGRHRPLDDAPDGRPLCRPCWEVPHAPPAFHPHLHRRPVKPEAGPYTGRHQESRSPWGRRTTVRALGHGTGREARPSIGRRKEAESSSGQTIPGRKATVGLAEPECYRSEGNAA